MAVDASLDDAENLRGASKEVGMSWNVRGSYAEFSWAA
jgi:hypothetical protein